ncbi:Protein Y41D4B.11 [Aphelenchoides avenae]|nr:Protein Y41D4B.11 [Aphelenchus avenae]
MARHRRYQVKRKQKIKPNAPYNPPGEFSGSKGANKRDFNMSKLDEQPVPRKVRELNYLRAKAEQLKNVKRVKKPSNKVLYETYKMGYEQRPWEDEDRLIARINRDANKDITDQIIKAKVGIAGRDAKEIAADYKELDAKAERRKLQKIARREKLLKLKEKEEKYKQTRKGREEAAFSGLLGSGDEGEDEEGGDEEGRDEEEDEVEEKEKPKATKKDKKAADSEPVEKRKRLGKNDKLRLKRKQEREAGQKELLLNAREVIAFGERVDGPPKFHSFHRKSLEQGFAQAGQKDLLLKRIFDKAAPKGPNANYEPLGTAKSFPWQKNEDGSPKKKRQKHVIDEGKRLAAIEAYRSQKKSRRDPETMPEVIL